MEKMAVFRDSCVLICSQIRANGNAADGIRIRPEAGSSAGGVKLGKMLK